MHPCHGCQSSRNVSMKIVAKDWKLMIRDKLIMFKSTMFINIIKIELASVLNARH